MRRLLPFAVLLALTFAALAGPPITKLTIAVTNQAGKPVDNASVVVKFIKGHDVLKLGKGIQHEWELRTGQEGTVKIPTIPQGKILIQIIAKNYQTFGDTFDVSEAEKTIDIKLNSPQKQYSSH
jgi:hypothetical protein